MMLVSQYLIISKKKKGLGTRLYTRRARTRGFKTHRNSSTRHPHIYMLVKLAKWCAGWMPKPRPPQIQLHVLNFMPTPNHD
ncbi:unnamed protein product [Coffea canephora]|uniref:Uncharacterized protein n=1 Tax=Coffea canephora TaxID=49390 RepID=A0A068V3Q3_COFCA|nr:unnamed protein product [Coffea canephora]